MGLMAPWFPYIACGVDAIHGKRALEAAENAGDADSEGLAMELIAVVGVYPVEAIDGG